MRRPPVRPRYRTKIESRPAGTRAKAALDGRPPVGGMDVKCTECSLRSLCLPSDLLPATHASIAAAISSRRRYGRGETLYNVGDRIAAVYAVRAGCFKTILMSEDGREQVTGFYMPGDVVGLDGIGNWYHASRAVALDDSEVCVISVSDLTRVGAESQPIQHHFHQLLSREISREQSVIAMLGSLSAEKRLAAFLVDLSKRLQARGYSPSDFQLPMTRGDIGSYLGLELETVSRMLAKLRAEGLVEVQHRHVRIRRLDALAGLVSR